MEYINREISWLSFNERVLQEARDPLNPLVERFKFLGIFSNNRDEFFKVRVASVRRKIQLHAGTKKGKETQELLDRIQDTVIRQQKLFDQTYKEMVKEAELQNIFFRDEKSLGETHRKNLSIYFKDEILPSITPIFIDQIKKMPNLRDKSLYFWIRIWFKDKEVPVQYSLLELPRTISRFVVIPDEETDGAIVLLLDDVIRMNMDTIYSFFPVKKLEAYTLKITRDAELDLDNDVSKSFLEKMSKSLRQRKKGQPVRLVYDKRMPDSMLEQFMKPYKINKTDAIIPSGRYHNFKDFMGFPKVGGPNLRFESHPPLEHPDLAGQRSMLKVIAKKDVLLHYPYHDFDIFINFLRECAIDPKVQSIRITLYRLAKQSKVINALINAARNGKKVVVVLELRARFDEENNIRYSNLLQEENVKVYFGVPNFKVHSKAVLVTRLEEEGERRYAMIGTGNMNEDSASIFSDLALFTCHKEISAELRQLFDIFEDPLLHNQDYKHLLLSPFALRETMADLINNEIENAQAGKPAHIRLKMNSLVDKKLIKQLNEAKTAGVKIELIVRGICSLAPSSDESEDRIRVISILDKFLEHARIFVFENGGKPKYYLSSADWMVRNLDHRVEVTCPIYEKHIQRDIDAIFDYQFKDNVKARTLDADQSNGYLRGSLSKSFRSQFELYNYYRDKA